jgi:hypothetical protein
MKLHVPATLKGSTEWKRSRKLRQQARVDALRDTEKHRGFTARYGRPPEEMTADEIQEPHSQTPRKSDQPNLSQ